jgi:hypothetical protein
MVSGLAQDPVQCHLGIAGLQTPFHRGADPALRLGVAHPLTEAVGIASELLRGRQCYRIDAVLDRDLAGGDLTKSPSVAAGNARFIQPYRSASSAS